MTQEDQESINKILNLPEWERFECKRVECEPSKLLRSICAMTNAYGGLLIIGLEDPKKASGKDRLFGIGSNLDNISELKKLIEKEFDPPIAPNISEFNILNNIGQNDKLLFIDIGKSPQVHSLKSGDTYMRVGNANQKLTASEIMRLNYDKGRYKYENEPIDIDLDQLDSKLINRYITDTNSSKNINQFLKDNGLSAKYNGKDVITTGGVLLFAKNPAVLLSHKCSIKISRYFGTLESFSENPNLVEKPKSIEGPLIKQISDTISEFDKIVSSSRPIAGNSGNFSSILKIPKWVFTEAVVNAVIHRNYSIPNDIQIRFFDDRIEIESPGAFPGHITVNNIREERFSRNPIIQRTLNRFSDSPNLDVGEGVNRMYKLMRDSNLYDPLYLPQEYRPNSVCVILLNMDRIGHWDVVSNYLDEVGFIKNQDARRITGIKDTLIMSRILADWTNKKLIRKVGEKKGAYYIKPGQELN